MVKDAEREVRKVAEKRRKSGKERLTRVINVQPSPGGGGENKKRRAVIRDNELSGTLSPHPRVFTRVLFCVE